MAWPDDERRCEMSLRQGDPQWSKHKLGTSTIGRVGCLATVYAQAMRTLGIDDEATPVDVVERGVFRGAAMLQLDTATRLGIVADDVTHAADVHRSMVAVLAKAMTANSVVVMHVDHDSAKPDGDPEGDHFVLGLRIEDTFVYFADPATGNEERMNLNSLTANVSSKRYQLRSVRPLRRAS